MPDNIIAADAGGNDSEGAGVSNSAASSDIPGIATANATAPRMTLTGSASALGSPDTSTLETILPVTANPAPQSPETHLRAVRSDERNKLYLKLQEFGLSLTRDEKNHVDWKASFEKYTAAVTEQAVRQQQQSQAVAEEQYKAQLDAARLNISQLEQAKAQAEREKATYILKSRVESALAAKALPGAVPFAAKAFLSEYEIIRSEDGSSELVKYQGTAVLNRQGGPATLAEAVESYLKQHDFLLPASARPGATASGSSTNTPSSASSEDAARGKVKISDLASGKVVLY